MDGLVLVAYGLRPAPRGRLLSDQQARLDLVRPRANRNFNGEKAMSNREDSENRKILERGALLLTEKDAEIKRYKDAAEHWKKQALHLHANLAKFRSQLDQFVNRAQALTMQGQKQDAEINRLKAELEKFEHDGAG